MTEFFRMVTLIPATKRHPPPFAIRACEVLESIPLLEATTFREPSWWATIKIQHSRAIPKGRQRSSCSRYIVWPHIDPGSMSCGLTRLETPKLLKITSRMDGSPEMWIADGAAGAWVSQQCMFC